MFGSRSVPPAMSIACGPSPARIAPPPRPSAARGAQTTAAASCGARLDPGFSCLCIAVAAFPRRQRRRSARDTARSGKLSARRADPCPLASIPSARSTLSGVIGNLVDAHADRVVDRVRDRRHHRQQRPLPDFLGAERAVRIRISRSRARCRPPACRARSGSCTRAARESCAPARCESFGGRRRNTCSSISASRQAHVHAALDLAAREHRVDACGRCRARSRSSAP